MKSKSAAMKDFIAAAVQADPTLKVAQAKTAYMSIVECMKSMLEEERSVRIPKVGTISVTTRKESVYRNPRSKDLIKKPAHKRLKFSISDSMKESLNS